MADAAELERVLRGVLAERFPDVTFERIIIEPGVDADGDDILLVKVVYDAEQETLDARRSSTVVRHLRPKLAELGEYAFPVLSYIAKSELGRSRAEAV